MQRELPRDLIIVTTPRSGSDFFQQWLLKLYRFGWTGEWLAAGTLAGVVDDLGLQERWTLQEFVAALRKKRSSSDGRISIKIMWDTFAWTRWKGASEGMKEGLFSAMQSPFCIYLIRKNKLAQAVSLYKARQTGIWHSGGENHQQDIEYNSGALVSSLHEIIAGDEAWKDWLRLTQTEYKKVYYEDFSAQPILSIQELMSNLGFNITSSEIHPDPPRNAILSNENNRYLIKRFSDEFHHLLPPQE